MKRKIKKNPILISFLHDGVADIVFAKWPYNELPNVGDIIDIDALVFLDHGLTGDNLFVLRYTSHGSILITRRCWGFSGGVYPYSESLYLEYDSEFDQTEDWLGQARKYYDEKNK